MHRTIGRVAVLGTHLRWDTRNLLDASDNQEAA